MNLKEGDTFSFIKITCDCAKFRGFIIVKALADKFKGGEEDCGVYEETSTGLTYEEQCQYVHETEFITKYKTECSKVHSRVCQTSYR